MGPIWEIEGFWGYVAGIVGSGGVLWKAIDAYRNWHSGRIAETAERMRAAAEAEERETNGLRELLAAAQAAQAEAEAGERCAAAARDSEARHRRRLEEALAVTRLFAVQRGVPLADIEREAPWPSRTKDNGITK